MAKSGRIWEITAGTVLALSFWGIMYPQFTLTTDAYQKIDENGPIGYCNSTEDYYAILDAEKGEISVRCGLLDDLLCAVRGGEDEGAERAKEAQASGIPATDAGRKGLPDMQAGRQPGQDAILSSQSAESRKK